jgi:hypothetical protein
MMSKKQNQEVMNKESSEVMNQEMMAEWGDGPELSGQDIIIPKILAMQGLSDLVTSRKAVMGEFRDNVSGELLGSIDAPIPFIPFYMEKIWIESMPKEGGKFKFSGITPITRKNEDLPWEDTDDKGKVLLKRDYTMQFYVLLPSDLEQGLTLPYVISFRRTSLRAGKKLATQMYVTNRQMQLPPAGKIMNLLGKIDSNNDGSYVVMDVGTEDNTPKEYMMKALEMFKIVQSGKAKVDHSDLSSEETQAHTQGEVSDKF